MTTRYLHRLAALLAFMPLSTPASAQALAYERPTVEAKPQPAAAYQVRLTSAWPQLGTTGDCPNGGDETVQGTIERNAAGDYAGTLSRRTLLLFCGAHGAAAQACTLVLEGSGPVVARGQLVSDPASPSGRAVHLSWSPTPTHAARTRGTCPPEFAAAVERMYLSVQHGAEFVLPAGGAPYRERLENYAWIVEIE